MRNGGHFVVNGQKVWTSGAHDADVVLAFVRTDPDAPKHKRVANGSLGHERCNYTKESPGWRVTANNEETGVHTAEFVTPAGARYRSTAPPLPGMPDIEITQLEVRIGIAIAEQDAA